MGILEVNLLIDLCRFLGAIVWASLDVKWYKYLFISFHISHIDLKCQ